MRRRRRICFVTGTRAEFGLMESTLRAIARRCELQIIATGMHLSKEHGRTIKMINENWAVDGAVPWVTDGNLPICNASAMGAMMVMLMLKLVRLRPDIVLVVGDRVEAFAAAATAHIGGIPLAHIHGGDRALGQIDDSLRHAITKLAHIHFPATAKSAQRIKKLGEQPFRIHCVGSPGIDRITKSAMKRTELRKQLPMTTGRFALLVLHPADPDEALEYQRAQMVYQAVRKTVPNVVVVYPNNDPGSNGIMRCWKEHKKDSGTVFIRNAARPMFLGMLRDAAMLIGNSSSGIIEAASFGTPVIDIGPRQLGREHGKNVRHVLYKSPVIIRVIKAIWNDGSPIRFKHENVYGRGDTAEKIARILATIQLNDQLRQKLITY